MNSTIFDLPGGFTNGQYPDVYFHFYSMNRSSSKHKVIFSQNLLCIVTRGIKEVFSHADHVKIDNKRLLLLTSGNVIMSEKTAEAGLFNSILIFFSNEFLTDFCMRHHILVSPKTGDPANLISLDKDDFLFNYEASLKLLEQTIKEKSSLQKIKIEELLLYLFKKYPLQIQLFIKQVLLHSSKHKLKHTVLANIEKNLTIDELAFLCNMSASSFKRHFSEVFEATPKKFFTHNRMQRARRLLLMNKRASDIYLELGYKNLSSFSNEFKKYFGLSPKQFCNTPDLKAKVFEPLG